MMPGISAAGTHAHTDTLQEASRIEQKPKKSETALDALPSYTDDTNIIQSDGTHCHPSHSLSIEKISLPLSTLCATDFPTSTWQADHAHTEKPAQTEHASRIETNNALYALAANIAQFDFSDRYHIYQKLQLSDTAQIFLEQQLDAQDYLGYEKTLGDYLAECYEREHADVSEAFTYEDLIAPAHALGINLVVLDEHQQSLLPSTITARVLDKTKETYSCLGHPLCDKIAARIGLYYKRSESVKGAPVGTTGKNTYYTLHTPSDLSAFAQQLSTEMALVREGAQALFTRHNGLEKGHPYHRTLSQWAKQFTGAGYGTRVDQMALEEFNRQMSEAFSHLLHFFECEVAKPLSTMPLAVINHTNNGQQSVCTAVNLAALESQSHSVSGEQDLMSTLQQCRDVVMDSATLKALFCAVNPAQTKPEIRATIKRFLPTLSLVATNRLIDLCQQTAQQPADAQTRFFKEAYGIVFGRSLMMDTRQLKQVAGYLTTLSTTAQQGLGLKPEHLAVFNALQTDSAPRTGEHLQNTVNDASMRHGNEPFEMANEALDGLHLSQQMHTKIDQTLHDVLAINGVEQQDKRLTDLLAETQTLNADHPNIATQIKEIATAIEAIHAHQDGKPHAKTVSPYPIAALAKMCEHIKSLYGIEVRDAQLIAVLTQLNPHNVGKGCLAQVHTGEGKSVITAMVALAKALAGETVDILTSSKTLAARDAEHFAPLYQAFNFTATCNCEGDAGNSEQIKHCYAGGQRAIVYGDAATFSADRLRNDFFKFGTCADRRATVGIVDEADSILLDRPGWLCQISEPIAGMSTCTPLLYLVWQHTVQALKSDNAIDLHSPDALKGYVQRLLPNIEAQVDTFLNSASMQSSAQTDTADTNAYFIPTHLQKFVKQRLAHWIQSAVSAAAIYAHNRQYVAAEPERTIIPIDYANTGEWEGDVQWEDGLHQFLQMAHQFPVTTESLTSAFMSNYTLISDYPAICGMSGTLGGQHEASCFKELFDVTTVRVPTFRDNRFEHRQDFLAAAEDAQTMKSLWFAAIHQDIVTDGQQDTLNNAVGLSDSTPPSMTMSTKLPRLKNQRERATLVVCKTIEDVHTLKDYLVSHGIAERDIVTYTRGEESASNLTKVRPGTVIVATNLSGRGTDIDASEIENAGGLHVILSFLPANERVQYQAFGRTARKGLSGSGRCIIQASELRDHHLFDSTLDIPQGQALAEKARLRHIMQAQKEWQQQADLFSRFQTYFHQLDDKLTITPEFQLLAEPLRKLYQKYVLDEWAIYFDAINHGRKPADFEQFTAMIHPNFEALIKDNDFYAIQYANILIDLVGMSANEGDKNKALTLADSLYEQATKKGGLTAGFAAYNRAFVALAKEASAIDTARQHLHGAQQIFKACQEKETLMLQLQFPNGNEQAIKTPLMLVIDTLLASATDQIQKLDALEGDYSKLSVGFASVMDLAADTEHTANAPSESDSTNNVVRTARIPREMIAECVRLGLKGPLVIDPKGDTTAAIVLAVLSTVIAIAALAAVAVTGGAAALVIGGAVSGAAISGAINAIKGAANGDFSLRQFGKDVAIGAVGGAVGAGAGGALGAVAGKFLTHGVMAVRVAAHGAVGATTGAASSMASYATEAAVNQKQVEGEEALMRLGKGALGGAIGGVGAGALHVAPTAMGGHVAIGATGDGIGDLAVQGVELATGRREAIDAWQALESAAISAMSAAISAAAQKGRQRRLDVVQEEAAVSEGRTQAGVGHLSDQFDHLSVQQKPLGSGIAAGDAVGRKVRQIRPSDNTVEPTVTRMKNKTTSVGPLNIHDFSVTPESTAAQRLAWAQTITADYAQAALPEHQFNRRTVRSQLDGQRHPEFGHPHALGRPASLHFEQGHQGALIFAPGMPWENAPPWGNKGGPSKGTKRATPDTPSESARPNFLRRARLDTGLRARAGDWVTSQPFQSQHVDRCHRVSFADLRDNVIRLTHAGDTAGLRSLVSAMPYDPQGVDYRHTTQAMNRLVQAIDAGANTRAAQQAVISQLNSCELNLTLGASGINRSNGRAFDPNLSAREGGYGYTPQTLRIAREFTRRGLDITPSRVVNGAISSSHGQQGQVVPVNLFTPQTRALHDRIALGNPPELRLPPPSLPVGSRVVPPDNFDD